MHFFVHKRKGTPTVIIVALIDILIVLLIFLMVTTTFKQQPALRLALPESTQAKKTGANENAPLLVSVDAQGNLRWGSGALPVTFDNLRSEMTAAAGKNPDQTLAISADKNAPIGTVVKVMDAVKESGLKKPPVLFTKEAGKQ